MRTLPAEPVFSRAATRRLGWTDSALTRAGASGRVIRVRRGWFTTPGGDLRRAAAIAAVLAHPGSVLSHRSAAMMHGLPIVGSREPLPELTVRPRGPGNITGAYVYRATLRDDDIVLVDGVPVTSVARTLVDLARHRSTACGVAAIDAALHEGRVAMAQIDRVLVQCWNWPRIRRAQHAVQLADARAESPLESVSRLVIGWLRLPAPEPQVLILDRYGAPAGRLDFYWDEFGVAGEADGRAKYRADPEERDHEKDRQEHIEDEGITFARWGWAEPWRRPKLLEAKICSAFERGQLRDRSGFPRRWSVIPSEIGRDGGKPDPHRSTTRS